MKLGKTTEDHFEVERQACWITGGFALRINLSAETKSGVRMTLVGADAGSDLAVQGEKIAQWSGVDKWSFLLPNGKPILIVMINDRREYGRLFYPLA